MQTEAQPTRTRILNAAREIFSENGFHSASMKAICKSCAISPGTLYHHFISKEALIQAIILQDQERALARFREPIEGIHFVDYMVESIVSLTHEAFGQRALVVEIMAEGMRNPQVAAMLKNKHSFKSTRENVVRIVAQPSLKISLQTLKRNRPLFMLCIGALCVLISTFAVSASSLFYVRYVLNDTGLFTVLVLVQNLVGTVASAPLVPGMVARIGKKNTFLIGALLGTCGYLLFFWVSVWSLPVALVALAIASIGQGVTMTVMWALEADTVEYGEYLTGVRIEGLTYSLFSFTRKCGQAIGGSIPAFILGLSGYIANQAQTPEVIMGIRTSIALVPCGFMLLAFVIIWFYPLTDKKFKEIVVEIDNRKKVQQQLINDITS